MTGAKFTVGQPVVVRSVNRGHGYDGVVTKVGRSLVTVVDARWPSSRGATFRMDDGRCNDAYGHEWVLTLDEAAAADHREAVIERLYGHRLRFTAGAYAAAVPTQTLEQIVDLLDASAQTDAP